MGLSQSLSAISHIEKERMSGQRSREAFEYEATLEEIKDNIKSTVGEALLKNGTFGDLEDRTDALQEAMSQFQPKKKEESKKKRTGSDIAVAQNDGELQITAPLEEIGKNMSTMIQRLENCSLPSNKHKQI